MATVNFSIRDEVEAEDSNKVFGSQNKSAVVADLNAPGQLPRSGGLVARSHSRASPLPEINKATQLQWELAAAREDRDGVRVAWDTRPVETSLQFSGRERLLGGAFKHVAGEPKPSEHRRHGGGAVHYERAGYFDLHRLAVWSNSARRSARRCSGNESGCSCVGPGRLFSAAFHAASDGRRGDYGNGLRAGQGYAAHVARYRFAQAEIPASDRARGNVDKAVVEIQLCSPMPDTPGERVPTGDATGW